MDKSCAGTTTLQIFPHDPGLSGYPSTFTFPSAMSPNFNGKPPAIPPGSTVLVTGANGFIGSHVTDQLIQAGYLVRGTSRDTAKTAWMTDMFDKKYGKGKFDAVVVTDMAESGAFDEACKGMLLWLRDQWTTPNLTHIF